MIYLFHGTDAGRVRARAFQWVALARMKAPDAPYVRLDGDAITEDALRNAVRAQGLFFTKSLILVDDPFAKAATRDVLLETLEELAASENPVGIIAPDLSAKDLNTLEAQSAKVFREDAPKKVARGFNSALVNALERRDARTLWLELERALRLGDAPEATHGILHWKARELMKKQSRTWTRDEARILSRTLIEMASDARSGGLPLATALERFALTLT